MYTSAKAKAEKLGQTFASKRQLQHAEDPAPDLKVTPSKTLDTAVFKANDIQRLLRKLNPDKATGPGGIPTRVLGEQPRISQTS